MSPSSRGRGLKCRNAGKSVSARQVALFTRAWIEIELLQMEYDTKQGVALFTRAWIEMLAVKWANIYAPSRPLHEGVD